MSKLELGPGTSPQPGFDLAMDILKRDCVTHIHDFRQFPWPFADNSMEAVVGLHILEHVTVELGRDVIRECFRVLQPGGTLRIHVPSRVAVFKAYEKNPTAAQRWELNRIVYGWEKLLDYNHQHQALYDFVLLGDSFQRAGFTEVKDLTFEIEDHHDKGWYHLLGEGNRCSLKVIGRKPG